jgi:hypothetical protein
MKSPSTSRTLCARGEHWRDVQYESRACRKEAGKVKTNLWKATAIVFVAAGIFAATGCSKSTSDASPQSAPAGKADGAGLTKEQIARVIGSCSKLKVNQVIAIFPVGSDLSVKFSVSFDSGTADEGEALFQKDTAGVWYLTKFATYKNIGLGMIGVNQVCGTKLPLKV